MKKFFKEENWLDHALKHNIVETITEVELKKRLQDKRKLRIKFGVDVTNPLIHLGNAVNLWKMREFQEQGHKVVFLIGDFTSLIGDPTGKSKTRPQRTKEEIEKDAKLYVDQVTRILLDDPEVFEIRRNSEWYSKMKLEEFLGLSARITHSRLISRDMFQKRMHDGAEIYMHEMLYPILQGYDSFMLESDLTVIGEDQLFNEMLGRHYQSVFGQDSQIIMTTVITPGIDGKEKQSKSLGNFIAIADTPEDKYGKVMTLPDNLIITYYKVYTFVDAKVIAGYEEEIKAGANPRDIKMRLAKDLVSLYHGPETAQKVEENFIKVFQKKETPEQVTEVKLDAPLSMQDFLKLHHKIRSNSEARRLLGGKGVRIGNEIADDPDFIIRPESAVIIKIGKRHFYQIKA